VLVTDRVPLANAFQKHCKTDLLLGYLPHEFVFLLKALRRDFSRWAE
jgi:hypothetical protein